MLDGFLLLLCIDFLIALMWWWEEILLRGRGMAPGSKVAEVVLYAEVTWPKNLWLSNIFRVS